MNAVPTPHDAFFKQFLTHPPTARDFLQIHLPETLQQHCDFNTLQLASGSFIEEDLRAFYSDILYSLKTDSGDSYIYCLIEHQSSADRNMTFRLMRYAIAVMQRHLDEGHTELPLVIPVLFYHGSTSPYPYSMSWFDAFSNPALARQIYAGHFPLVDITVIPDDVIMTHRRMALLELLQKHIRQRDLHELLDPLVTLMWADYTTDDQLTAAFYYMLHTGEMRELEPMLHALGQKKPKLKEEIMTIAERLRQEGREIGREIGRKECNEQLARLMLAKKYELASIMELTGMTESEIKQLLR